MTDWFKVYGEYNKDSERFEVLVVGERSGKTYKATKTFDKIDLSTFDWINNRSDEYFKL